MENIRKYINIPPGKLLSRWLAEKGVSQVELANRIGVLPQELNAIVKCRRKIPLELSLKIERELSMDEGFIAQLQLLNSIEQIKRNSQMKKQPPKVKRILFWDTDFDNINWSYSKDFVIKRVEQYGSPEEIQTIREYYGIN